MTTLKTLTDHQLIELLKKDDRLAFTEIYHRYAKGLTGFAVSNYKLFDLTDASDVLHDLFAWLWTERRHLEITGSLKNYLFTAIRNRIIDHIRKNSNKLRYAAFLQALEQSYAHSALQHLEAKDLKQHLVNSLTKLSPRVQEIYNLSRTEHLSVKEIAERLAISEQTVKNQLTTALNYLKKSLPLLTFLLMRF
jgi:RNA polymerase sigma-70 factor (family 1)